jgi:hypothetical protein
MDNVNKPLPITLSAVTPSDVMGIEEKRGIKANTRDQYESRANTLIREALGINDEICYLPPAKLLIEKFETGKIATATYRLYKAALLHVMATNPLSDAESAIEMLNQAKAKNRSTYQRVRRRVGIPEDDFRRLTGYLLARGQEIQIHPKSGSLQTSTLAAYWLAAGIETGLRPSEWFSAAISDWNPGASPPSVLRTVTAKSRNESGAQRELPIDDPRVYESLRVFRYTLDLWRAHFRSKGGSNTDGDQRLIQVTSEVIVRASKALWPTEPNRRYTLYAARHQAAANMRAFLDLDNTAKLLGHDSRTSATYGKNAQAWAVGE